MAVPNGAGAGPGPAGTGTGPGGPGGGLRAAAGLYEQLKGEWGRKSPNLAKCGEALGRLKVSGLRGLGVPDGGQLQQSVPGQGQHPSRELHLLHRHPAGHHPGRDRGLHRGRLRADPVPRGGADPLLQLAPQDDRLRQEAGLGAGSLQLLQFWGAAAESRGPPDPLDGAGHAGDRVRPAAGDDRLKHNKFLLFLFIPIFSAFFFVFFPPFSVLFSVFFGRFQSLKWFILVFFFFGWNPIQNCSKIIQFPTLRPHSKISPNPVRSPYFSYFIAFLGVEMAF
ncbi:26S proteasome non-ATPase regulatory subunit 8 [Lonchura striata]|uniref:26S proteasome non-ATPase regulatory subunit 8 n=1 Tax=Lonchura striata TaxID=40157 RepID=A0A218UBR3_9PASE|nr:26S proteasome non-ATPase regulatory subunit 8 [Lonchura striata domestica]